MLGNCHDMINYYHMNTGQRKNNIFYITGIYILI